MGGVGRLAYQDFLVREACVGVLVGRAFFFCLECNEMPSSNQKNETATSTLKQPFFSSIL